MHGLKCDSKRGGGVSGRRGERGQARGV
jgi:hypothetical protein